MQTAAVDEKIASWSTWAPLYQVLSQQGEVGRGQVCVGFVLGG